MLTPALRAGRMPSGLRPPFSEGGRLRLIDFPVEEFVIAGPGVDFDTANLAAKAAGMPGRMLLARRGVRQPAIGTAKILGLPNLACHGAIMRRTVQVFQRSSQP